MSQHAFTASEPGYTYAVTESALSEAIALAIGTVGSARLAGRRRSSISLQLAERSVQARIRVRVAAGEALPTVGEAVRVATASALVRLCGSSVESVDVDVVGLRGRP